MRLAQAAKALKDAVVSPVNRQVEKFIKWVLESFVNEQNLRQAIDEDIDILKLALNHYGLSHSTVTPLFKLTLKMYWDEAEAYLTDVQRIIDTISKKPRCKEIIDTPEGRDYLNRCAQASYDHLYAFVWEEEE